MESMKKKIVAVVGPTAGGKSALALALAEKYGGQIISCDSMQIYRRMDIGTAKPSTRDMARVRHRMIDMLEPDENFSCADYVRMARAETDDVLCVPALPIFCGGTGLYLDAFLRGDAFAETKTDSALRRELENYAAENGAEALHGMLRRIDPESADAIHPNNIKRVIRAIEIYRTSGITKSEADRRSLEVPSEYDALVIGLRYSDRALLGERIDRRVDCMLAEGLVGETEMLMNEGIFEKNLTAAQAIGYKEILPYLLGECSLDEAVQALKSATRRYAKRQMTWFSSKKYVHWIEADRDGRQRTFEEIVNNASELFLMYGFCDKI